MLHILTAPGREAILARSLASLRASDWPVAPRIFTDPGPLNMHPRHRIPAAWRAMLADALENRPARNMFTNHRDMKDPANAGLTVHREAPILFCEDDIAYHPHIFEIIKDDMWLLADGIPTFASLYNPGIPSLSAAYNNAPWFVPDPRRIIGAQALLIAGEFIPILLRDWEKWPLPPSRRIARIYLNHCPEKAPWIHRPSLVEHAAETSSWGVALHRSIDFDPAHIPANIQKMRDQYGIPGYCKNNHW